MIDYSENEVQTRLDTLSQHLDLLIHATGQTDSLRGYEVSCTFTLIQKEINEIQAQLQQKTKKMTRAARYRYLCEQLNIQSEITENGTSPSLDELEQRYAESK